MRKLLLVLLSLFALGMLAAACGGGEAVPSGVTAEEVERIVSEALAAQPAASTAIPAPVGLFVIGVMESLTGPRRNLWKCVRPGQATGGERDKRSGRD